MKFRRVDGECQNHSVDIGDGRANQNVAARPNFFDHADIYGGGECESLFADAVGMNADLREKIFTPYSTEKPGVNNYGLGFRMKVFDNGEKLTFHTGWWHGSNVVFAHLLKSNVTIVAVGNKFSRRIYSALSIAGLFEDFPLERDRFFATIKQPVFGTDTLSAAAAISEE